MNKKLRLCVCIEHDGIPFKISWMHEDKQGVYMGIYGERYASTHTSYHLDGKHLTRLVVDSGDYIKMPTEIPASLNQREPILSIRKWSYLNAQSMNISPQVIADLSKKHKATDPSQKLDVDMTKLGPSKNIGIASYLLSPSAEKEFQEKLTLWHQNNSLTPVSINYFDLSYFPDLKLAVSLYSDHQLHGGIRALGGFEP